MAIHHWQPAWPHPRPLSRRRFLGGTLAGVCLIPKASQSQDVVAANGFRLLRAKPASASLPWPAGKLIPVAAYDGSVPGPLLRVRRGDELKIRLVNELAAPTAVHWHGVRLKNAMDGVPPLTQAAIEPGGAFDYRFVPPDAGTFWYHPPGRGQGLYGLLIVDEPDPVGSDHDVVLILDEVGSAAGSAGDSHVTVNGTEAFKIPVKANERLRLRLLNAAGGRPFMVRVDRHRAVVMAVDGQPAEPFAARDARVALGPGNRVDLFVDCTLAPGATAPILLETATDPLPVAHLIYGIETARPAPLPDPKPLPANPLPERMDFRSALRADLAITGGASPVLATRPLFSAKRGRTVVLNILNRTDTPQVTHVHGHAFRLLDRLDDGWKPFWLDTIAVLPQGNDHIAFVADNPGKWLIHSHAQSASLLAWFDVS